jgi:putative tryptophan/tyrosine transport system substrate-binding protein
MRRREFISLLGGGAVAWPLAARAQQASKTYRIGFLANDPTIPSQPAGKAFLDGLKENGFIEGQNLIIERRFAEGKLDRYDTFIAELMRLQIDVLVTSFNAATLAAKRASIKIPVVMMNVSDPLGQGFVTNLAHPHANITGTSGDDSAEVAAKRLQLLKDIAPGTLRVGVLINPDLPYAQAQWHQLEHAADLLSMTLRRLDVRRSNEIEEVFGTIAQARLDAAFVTNSELAFVNRRLIAELAAKLRLPTMANVREAAQAGALISYGNDRSESFHRAAMYVAKILKGAKPSDLPIEQPTKYELVINSKTAKSLGLEIPRELLLIADEVIE